MTDREGVFSRSLPLILLLFTSGIAAGILGIKDSRWTDSFYILVINSRDTVGLVIQVISAALGACQVFALTSTVSLSTRLSFQSRGVTQFRKLHVIAAIISGSFPALRTKLLTSWLALTSILIVALKIPAALWAGAITPVLTDVTKDEGYIQVPSYNATTWEVKNWQSGIRRTADGTVDQNLLCNSTMAADWIIPGGIASVSTCPAVDLIGTLLGSLATSAITNLSFPKPHARVDGSGWASLGRSYGVGSLPGILELKDLPQRRAPILSFNYNETGYRVDVSCLRNGSSNFGFGAVHNVKGYDLRLITAQGMLPNSEPGRLETYVTTSAPSPKKNFMAWSALSNRGANVLAVAATGWYGNKTATPNFDQMQCDIQFVPSLFAVYVNMTDTTITATPMVGDAEDIEPTGQFTTSVFLSLEQISRLSGQDVISTLGTPLKHGAQLLSKSDPKLLPEQVNKLALEAGAARLLDSLLIANAHSQMILLHNTVTAPLQVRYQAVKLGSDRYVIAVLATNIALLLAVLVETVRTKFWKGLDQFDPTDVEDVGIAISAGGSSIAEKCLLVDGQFSSISGSQPLKWTREKGHWTLTALLGAVETELRSEAAGDEPSQSAMWTRQRRLVSRLAQQQVLRDPFRYETLNQG